MEKAIFEYLAKVLEPNTLILLAMFLFQIRVMLAVRAGLLSHLTRIHSATMGKDYIRKDTYQIAEECFKQYKALHGDGYADGIMDDIRKIPRK